MTHLCVSIVVHTAEQALADAARAAELGADMVEYRIDTVSDEHVVREVASRSIVPCIMTCRAEPEGGESPHGDAVRIALLDAAAQAGPVYRDVELATFERNADHFRRHPERLILSHHDFKGRPPRLYNVLESLAASGPHVHKVAWLARSVRDNVEAFEILLARQGPMICLCMGEVGRVSRLLAKKFGAFLTFASLDREHVTAPGQPTIGDLKRLYRWDAIKSDTKVFGVAGSPVAHSMSPAVHNAAFDATGFNGVYVPLFVEHSFESFKAFMETFLAFGPLQLSGLSVTLPHKENALRYLSSGGAEIDELSQRIGAVNTIAIDEGQTLRGLNTDYSALLDTITSTLSIGPGHLSDCRVAVIGAGGAARTAVAAMAHHGATVVVYNRTRERADALAEEFNGKRGKVVAARLEKLCDSCCDVYINATPVGMHPQVDATPLGERLPKFTDRSLVFDTIYNPTQTKFLQQARDAGAKTVGGAEMFLRQAAQQFRIFTGLEPPLDAMRRAFQERLHRATSD